MECRSRERDSTLLYLQQMIRKFLALFIKNFFLAIITMRMHGRFLEYFTFLVLYYLTSAKSNGQRMTYWPSCSMTVYAMVVWSGLHC